MILLYRRRIVVGLGRNAVLHLEETVRIVGAAVRPNKMMSKYLKTARYFLKIPR